MTIPLTSLRCNRCDFSQPGRLITGHVYALPDGSTLPVMSRPGWCAECGEVQSMEDLSLDRWLDLLTTTHREIASSRLDNKLTGSRWEYNAMGRFDGVGYTVEVSPRTIEEWAIRINQAIVAIGVLRNRKSPPRCLKCGSVSTIPLETKSPESETFLHPGCGGELETIVVGDILPKTPSSWPTRTYTLEGEYIDWFLDKRLEVKEPA